MTFRVNLESRGITCIWASNEGNGAISEGEMIPVIECTDKSGAKIENVNMQIIEANSSGLLIELSFACDGAYEVFHIPFERIGSVKH